MIQGRIYLRNPSTFLVSSFAIQNVLIVEAYLSHSFLIFFLGDSGFLWIRGSNRKDNKQQAFGTNEKY